MNKIKREFMQAAPYFVLIGGVGFMIVFFLIGILLCFTKERSFGIFMIILTSISIGGLSLIFCWFEKTTGKSIFKVLEENEEYWKKHKG